MTTSDDACVRGFLEGDAAAVRQIDVWIGQGAASLRTYVWRVAQVRTV